MSLISVLLLIALVLMLSGIGLMVWAYINPRWQTADAFDCVVPFAIGGVFLTISWVGLIALAIFYLFLRG